MTLQESGEMYLETIYVLSRTSKQIRSIDVVKHMGFSKPSVSRAVGLLKSDGYITTDESGYLKLSSTGLKIARKIYERHQVLTEMLTSLGVDEKTASDDACRIEHYISDKSFKAIKKHVKEDLTRR